MVKFKNLTFAKYEAATSPLCPPPTIIASLSILRHSYLILIPNYHLRAMFFMALVDISIYARITMRTLLICMVY